MEPRCRPNPVAVATWAAAVGLWLAGCGGSAITSETVETIPATTIESTQPPTTVSATTAVATTTPVSVNPPTTTSTTAPPSVSVDTSVPAPTVVTVPPDPGGGGGGGTGTSGPMTIDSIRAVLDPSGESASLDVLAWGDVDDDGDDDAVALISFCGASCGSNLYLVLNGAAGPVVAEYQGVESFAPWYTGGGAAQSSVTSVTINGSTIVLVGTGLCGDVPIAETDEPGSCNFFTERTATYQYTNSILSAVAIDPQPG